MRRILTISRQFGSRGRTIGAMVAKELGIPLYDREIIRRTSETSGLEEEFVEERSEQGYGWFERIISSREMSFGSKSPEEYIWEKQCKVIIDLAKKGSCVFVGRCADWVLRGKEDILDAFIYAPIEYRAKTASELYDVGDLSEERVLKMVKEKDKRRAAYYKFFTDREFGDLKNYDVCLNSGVLGIENCAQVLIDLYKNKK